MFDTALRQKEEETKEIEEKMRQAEEEARKVEEARKQAEEERKRYEAEKAQNEAAVSINISFNWFTHCTPTKWPVVPTTPAPAPMDTSRATPLRND